MGSRRKQTVGVIFGGRSVEHEVSIVTGQQIMNALAERGHTIVPVYITREGRWLTGESLRRIENFKDERYLSQPDVQMAILSPDVRQHGLIFNPLAGRFARSRVLRLDVLFPAIHGNHGEDGTLQGLFELADIPYVGFATLGSALTNDKVLTKQIMQMNRIAVVEGIAVERDAWRAEPDSVIKAIETQLTYPVFVKPATLGSSIGVGPAEDREMLRLRLDIAANFDRRILVERAITGGIEINCAVMGYGQAIKTSVLEQPLSWDQFLTYEDKYLRGGEGMKSADRIIPAPVSPQLTERIQNISRQAFKAVDGRGIVRIDYLIDPNEETIYLNEMNTLPGSLAFYLWQATGMAPGQVVDELIDLAYEAHADKRRNMYDYRTNLIQVAAGRGLKGTKGSKGSKKL